MNRHSSTAFAVGVALLLATSPALAQAVGGGGGAAEAIYQWFMQNIWAGILLVVIVGLGVGWAFGRVNLWLVGAGLLAAAVVKFAPDIRSMLM